MNDLSPCTEPQLWTKIPDWDAPDAKVQRYLEHVETCPYHAEIEQRKKESFHLTVDVARSLSPSGDLDLSNAEDDDELLKHFEQFETLQESGIAITSLSIRANGREIEKLDLKKGYEHTFEIRDTRLIQIWKPADAQGPEVLLATYVATDRIKTPSSVVLPGNQILSIGANALDKDRFLIRVSCTQQVLPLSKTESFKKKWYQDRKLALAAAVLLFGSVGAFVYFTSGEDNNASVARRYDPDLGEDKQPSPARGPSPTGSPNQLKPSPTPGISGQKPPQTIKKPSEDKPRAGGLTTTKWRDIRTIYVDEQQGGFKQNLRNALKLELERLGLDTDVDRDTAEARLRITSSGHRLTFEFISGRQTLFLHKRIRNISPEEASRLGQEVIRDFNARRKLAP